MSTKDEPDNKELTPGDPDTLTSVREIGFNTTMVMGGQGSETIFFIGPVHVHGRPRHGKHATEEAVKEFIAYWKNQIEVAKDYLANGRNNKTHEWHRTSAEEGSARRTSPCTNTCAGS